MSDDTINDISKRVIESRVITEFQRKVYLELLNIPKGETISYVSLVHSYKSYLPSHDKVTHLEKSWQALPYR